MRGSPAWGLDLEDAREFDDLHIIIASSHDKLHFTRDCETDELTVIAETLLAGIVPGAWHG